MMNRTIHLSYSQYQSLSTKDPNSLYVTESGIFIGTSRLVKETHEGIAEVSKLKIGTFVFQVNLESGVLEIHDTATDNFYELTTV